MKYDFTEMDKLEAYLKDHDYNYERKNFLDGQQIIVCDALGNREWDVIMHYGSYGIEKNLMEAMGYALIGHDDVEGCLTADDVIHYLE